MLFDEHRECRNQHGVKLTSDTLCKSSIVGSYHTQFLVFYPLFESNDVLGHIPYLFNRAATLNLEGVEDVLGLSFDGSLVGDVIGDSPHLLPVELLGIDEHTMVEVGLVDVEIHHARIRTADLGDVRIAETAAHLGSTAPVFDFSLYLWVATFDNAGNDGRALAGTVQVGYHFTDGTTGVELTKPCGDIGLGVVGRQFLLYVDDDDRYVKVAHGG